MDLDNLKYSELQKLAKTAGIKANMKVEKLVKALKEHYTSQEQSDSNNHKADEDCSTQADAPKKDQSSANEDESAEKKGPSRGRKKGQKKGGRGKAKKTADECHEERTETQKTGTPQNGSTSSSLLSPKAKLQGTPGSKQAFISKKTPQAMTPNVSKTPTIVKPVSSKTLQNRKPEVKKTDLKLTPARTPGTGPKNTHTKVITGKNTPGLFSPRVPPPSQSSSISTEKIMPKRSSSTGKKLTSSATKENKKSPLSGGVKRRSPRNETTADENKQNEAKVSPVNSGSKRKRQSTFELEGPSLASTATPEAEMTMKRVRRSTGSEQPDKTTPSSPGIQDMIDSMGGEISSAERRKRLMSALDKKVESKVKSSPQTGPVTQIPRFAAFLAKKRQEQKKPITPGNKDWEKVHKKEFSKFDSIDVYLEKKRKRAEEMTASVKKARTVLHEVQEAVAKLKNKRTPSQGGKAADKPFKPTVISTKDMNLNFGATASSTKTPTQKKSTSSKPFKPTVTSTKDMNLNFSSLKTPVNQKKAAEKVTPAPNMQNGAQSARKSVGPNQMSVRKSLGVSSARKSLSSTPFQFTGNLNMSEVKSTTKPVFDLKASLARPITWKPHTGKLKPMAESYVTKGKELESSATKPASSRKDIFKSMVNRTQRTYSRHDRRVAAAVKRAEQKHDLQMKRRGITVSP